MIAQRRRPSRWIYNAAHGRWDAIQMVAAHFSSARIPLRYPGRTPWLQAIWSKFKTSRSATIGERF